MRKITNKKLVNLMMAGVMAAGVIMAPASTFAAKTCSICGHKFDTYDGIVSSWYNRKDGVSQRIDIFEDGSFSIMYTSFKEYTGKKIVGDWNRSMDGENTFNLVERDGNFIQTVKLSDNGNYLTTYINGEEYIFYKDNAEINIPLGADAGADEESFGGTWVTEYEGYNILLTVEDGNVKFSVLENPGNNAEAFGRSFVRSERYGSDTAFKRYYYDFTISDLEVGWENIPCHMFMMENGTIRLVAGDKFKRYFLIFEKICVSRPCRLRLQGLFVLF